jgi:hypothetical protein
MLPMRTSALVGLTLVIDGVHVEVPEGVRG